MYLLPLNITLNQPPSTDFPILAKCCPSLCIPGCLLWNSANSTCVFGMAKTRMPPTASKCLHLSRACRSRKTHSTSKHWQPTHSAEESTCCQQQNINSNLCIGMRVAFPNMSPTTHPCGICSNSLLHHKPKFSIQGSICLDVNLFIFYFFQILHFKLFR